MSDNRLVFEIIGDNGVGKSTMLTRMLYGDSTSQDNTIRYEFSESEKTMVTYEETPYTVVLWDAKIDREWDRIRMLGYSTVDVFLVCFSLTEKSTLRNACQRWIQEIRQFCLPTIPVVLIGTKLDLREAQKKEKKKLNCVSYSKGLRMAKKIGAATYMECSNTNAASSRLILEAAVEAHCLSGNDALPARCTIV